MCGIVGYTGHREAYPIIIKGLKRLEYRGYDSTGVALQNGGSLNVYKKKGKVSELEQSMTYCGSKARRIMYDACRQINNLDVISGVTSSVRRRCRTRSSELGFALAHAQKYGY